MSAFTQKLRNSGWNDPVHLLTLLTLGAALLFGGGGAAAPFNNGVLISLSLLLLASVLFMHFTGRRPLPTIALWPSLLMLGLLALGIFQLTAVTGGPWLDTPGRATERALLELFGSDVARPLSLDTEATSRALAAFILPFALLLGALGSTRKQLRICLLVIAAAAVIHAVMGVAQVALGYPDHLRFYNQGRYVPVPSGLFANANHFGTYMTIGILAVAAIGSMPRDSHRHRHPNLRQALRSKTNWALLLLLPLFALLVMAAGTRAGIFLLLLSVPVSIIATLRLKVSARLPFLLLLAPLLLLGAALAFPQLQTLAISERFWNPDDVRFAIIPDVVYIVDIFSPWGTGLGGFDGAFRASENLDLVGPFYINHAHNDWLEWVLETGIPGAILLGLALVSFLVLTVRGWIRASDGFTLDRYLIIVALTVVLALAIHSIVDYPARIAAIAAPLAIFIALSWLPWTADRPAGPVAGRAFSWIVGAGLLLIALSLSYGVIRIHAAEEAYRDGRHSAAVQLNPRHGEALAAIAGRIKEDSDPDQFIRISRRAIMERPYTARAVRALAVAIQLDGEENNMAWPLAASLGWRDAATQRWAFMQALEVEEYPIAALRADALMRTRDEPDNFNEVLWQLSQLPEFRTALLDRLALNPEWREAWLAEGPSGDRKSIDGAVALLPELAARGRVSPKELGGTMRQLIAQGRGAEAVRLHALLPDRDPSSALLTDGGFDRSPDLYKGALTPFDWRLQEGEGFVANVEGGADPYLYLESDGRNRNIIVERMFGLSPGAYRLAFEAINDEQGIERLALVLLCVGSDQPLVNQPLSSGTNRADFTVGANCPVVMMAIAAQIADDYVNASLDDFSLSKR